MDRSNFKRIQRGALLKIFLPVAIGAALILHPPSAAAALRTVTNLNNSGAGSLRQAILDSGASDTIVFSAGLAGSITLTGALVISTSLTITGPGSALLRVSGNTSNRVFNITGGTVNLSDLAIVNGYDASSGAGVNNSATLNVNRCQFTGNSAHDGGGINNASGASLAVTNSTFFGNLSDTGGGIANRGTAVIVNSTLTGNLGNNGSGLYSSTVGTLRLLNVTLAGNGNGASTYGGFYNFAGTAFIQNTIVALNANSGFGGPDVTGTVTSQGNNLIGKTNNSAGWIASDLKGSMAAPLLPLIGPLQDNGGTTWTRALLAGSPAIDAGAGGMTTDQRGNTRPYDNPGVANAPGGNGSDIGAFELGAGEISTLVVYTTNDSGAGSLRQAILNVPLFNIATITFAPAVTGTITLTSGQLVVSNTAAILGPGAPVLTVNGNGAGRVFSMDGGTVNLSGLTLANGFDANRGGDLFNRTALTVTNCVLTGGSSHDGGGIFNETNGALTVASSAIAGNIGETGPGLVNRGLATLRNSTIASNGLGGGVNGCAIYNLGTLTVLGCTVAGNGNAGVATGGVFNNQAAGTVNVRNTIIAANTSNLGGPDVFGTFASQGNNLIGRTNNSSGWLAGDRKGSVAAPLNPLLGPLQNNGGPTPTMALLSGSSPALDAGISGGLTFDQRGRVRPFDHPAITNALGGDGSDIGAYELIAPTLNIERSAPNVVLRWSTNDTGYSVESALVLTNPVSWAPVPGPQSVVGSQFAVTNGPATTNRFYRLKK